MAAVRTLVVGATRRINHAHLLAVVVPVLVRLTTRLELVNVVVHLLHGVAQAYV